MKKFIEIAQALSLYSICLLSLFILGAEPVNASDEAFTQYDAMWKDGGIGIYMFYAWTGLLLTLAVTSFIKLSFKEV